MKIALQWCSIKFEKWRTVRVSVVGVGGVDVLDVDCVVTWMAYYYYYCYYRDTILKNEEKNTDCLLLKQKWKNVPNRPEQWFKRRTWLEGQVLLYIVWTCNAKVLNMSEPQCGQICLDLCNFVNMHEYSWNITCLNKPKF